MLKRSPRWFEHWDIGGTYLENLIKIFSVIATSQFQFPIQIQFEFGQQNVPVHQQMNQNMLV